MGSMFVGNKNSVVSWGFYFVGNWWKMLSGWYLYTEIKACSWGCQFVGQGWPTRSMNIDPPWTVMIQKYFLIAIWSGDKKNKSPNPGQKRILIKYLEHALDESLF
jgi:hypothetical protein